ncbi:MAG TPA: SPFH domain-containing protein, partial [Pyrinomonadaceae bacterium]|nr:SPFH domain-containing protein [Pyrinomonadaceae bacterium]
RYISDDPEELPQRVVNQVKVLTRKEVQTLPLREALRSSDALVERVTEELRAARDIAALGLDVLGVSILAIKPTPETARALEAEARESLLREADEAIYARRNSAVEQERAIKENELNTEVAVENKKRQIREAQMEAERAVQEKQHELRRADMTARVSLEEQNRELVALAAENARVEADARAYNISEVMKALEKVDARTLQAVVSGGMRPDQMIAQAFQGLAERADKIGQLNVSPELLHELLAKPAPRGERNK